MWLIKYISSNTKKPGTASMGGIANSNDGRVQVNADTAHIKTPVIAPFGIAYVPPAGQDSVVLPLDRGSVCIGTVMKSKPLKPGEIMLFSAGGASLLLRNDGKVLINGREV